MTTGGNNNVDSERMSQLEREVTGISTDVKYIVKMIDKLATKDAMTALENRVEKLESSRQTTFSNLVSVLAIAVSIWAIYHH